VESPRKGYDISCAQVIQYIKTVKMVMNGKYTRIWKDDTVTLL
jgi:hypothetical protein